MMARVAEKGKKLWVGGDHALGPGFAVSGILYGHCENLCSSIYRSRGVRSVLILKSRKWG